MEVFVVILEDLSSFASHLHRFALQLHNSRTLNPAYHVRVMTISRDRNTSRGMAIARTASPQNHAVKGVIVVGITIWWTANQIVTWKPPRQPKLLISLIIIRSKRNSTAPASFGNLNEVLEIAMQPKQNYPDLYYIILHIYTHNIYI